MCKTLQNQNLLNGFIYFYARGLRKYAPGLIHPCPYIGEEGLKDGDIEAIMGETVPQVIPKGLYQILLRFHLTDNQTFLNVYITCQVDAKDPLKAFDMVGK